MFKLNLRLITAASLEGAAMQAEHCGLRSFILPWRYASACRLFNEAMRNPGHPLHEEQVRLSRKFYKGMGLSDELSDSIIELACYRETLVEVV